MSENLRSLIRQFILEDRQTFLDKTDDIDYTGDYNDPTFETHKDLKPSARKLKQAWQSESDQSFFKGANKIHWVGVLDRKNDALNQLNWILSSSGRDEISATLFKKGNSGKHFVMLRYFQPICGVVLDGWTTYAANTFANTGRGAGMSKEITDKYAASGVPRRPTMRNKDPKGFYKDDPILLEPDVVDYRQGINEVVLDNWKPVGIVISEFDEITEYFANGTPPDYDSWYKHKYMQHVPCMEKAAQTGLPLYSDMGMRPISKEDVMALAETIKSSKPVRK